LHGETNWKNLHFQLFHTNTLANPIKSHQMSVAWGNKLEKRPFSTFPYQHLDKFDQMTICSGYRGNKLEKRQFSTFPYQHLDAKRGDLPEKTGQKRRKVVNKWVNIAPKPNKYCTIFT
jgi:hypothetical protein